MSSALLVSIIPAAIIALAVGLLIGALIQKRHYANDLKNAGHTAEGIIETAKKEAATLKKKQFSRRRTKPINIAAKLRLS